MSISLSRPAAVRQPAVLLFLLLLVLLVSANVFTGTHTGNSPGKGFYALAGMWAPGFAALATCKILRRDLSTLGWGWKGRYQLAAYLIPIAYTLPVYVAVWCLRLGGFPNYEYLASIRTEFGWQTLPTPVVLTLFVFLQSTLGIIIASVYALGEEIGWRGFLLPELAKTTTLTRASLLTGLVWFVFHLPLLIFSSYFSPTKDGLIFRLACFGVMLLAMSITMGHLRVASGSLWTATLFHASHNVFIQDVLTPLTIQQGTTAYLIDECGIGIALTTTLFAIYASRKSSLRPR